MHYLLAYLLCAVYTKSLSTSNVTGRHRGPKRKLQAGYRASSLQCMSYVCELLFCETNSIFNRRVWYRTLYLCMCLLCKYSTFVHHPHPLGYPCAKFRFCPTHHCWASPQRKITCSLILSLNHSLNHSPSLFDSLATLHTTLKSTIIDINI